MRAHPCVGNDCALVNSARQPVTGARRSVLRIVHTPDLAQTIIIGAGVVVVAISRCLCSAFTPTAAVTSVVFGALIGVVARRPTGQARPRLLILAGIARLAIISGVLLVGVATDLVDQTVIGLDRVLTRAVVAHIIGA